MSAHLGCSPRTACRCGRSRSRSRRRSAARRAASQSARSSAGTRVVEAHPARALHDRLEDHGGELVRAANSARRRRCVPTASQRRAAARRCARASTREQRVHAGVGIAHRHRAERVAVVAAAPSAAVRRSPCQYCRRDLDRDLDRTGARVARRTRGRGRSRRPTARASRIAGSWVSPPNITCAMRSSWSPTPRRAPGGGSRGSRPTTTTCRRSARARRRASAGRPAPRPRQRRLRAGIGPYGCQTWRRSSASSSSHNVGVTLLTLRVEAVRAGRRTSPCPGRSRPGRRPAAGSSGRA